MEASLAINYQDGGQPIAQTTFGAGSIAFGVPFGTLDTPAGLTNRAVNRLITFNGALFAAVGNEIYMSTDLGSSWEVVYTIYDLSTSTTAKSGLNLLMSGQTWICLVYQTTGTAGRLKALRSLDGVTWEESNPYLIPMNNTEVPTSIISDTVWGSTLWIVVRGVNTAYLICYDVGVNYFTANGNLGQVGGVPGTDSPDIAIANNSVLVSTSLGSSVRYIAKYFYRSFGFPYAIGSAGIYGSGGCTAIFSEREDGENFDRVYFLYWFNANPTGWVCVGSTDEAMASWVDISSTVLPDFMRYFPGPLPPANSPPNTGNAQVIYRYQDSPGQKPEIYILYATDRVSGTPTYQYRWNGRNNKMTLVDSGGNVQLAISRTKNPNGWTFIPSGGSSGSSITILDVTFGTGSGLVPTARIKFKPYRSATSVMYIRGLWSYGNTTPENQMTFDLPGFPTYVSVTADNGDVTYTLPWRYDSDNVDTTKQVNFFLYNFTPSVPDYPSVFLPPD